MCGITGIIAFTEPGTAFLDKIRKANDCLALRGPDNEGFFAAPGLALGHRRLSIIDISDAANQPMQDPSGRFTIIFNGEFFNFREHREVLLTQGEKF